MTKQQSAQTPNSPQEDQPQQNTEVSPQHVPPGNAPADAPVKTKPPVSTRILYVLGFLGMIFGLFASVLIFFSSTQSDIVAAFSILGFSGVDLKLTAVFLAVFVIFGFYLIHEIRAGKKWALTVYSTIAGLASASILYDLLLGNASRDTGIDAVIMVIIALLLGDLWLNQRSYFK